MKIALVVLIAIVIAACVRLSLQPPTPEWAEWCIKNGGKLEHMYGQLWVCDLNPPDEEKADDGPA
jgi:hypothetical protein